MQETLIIIKPDATARGLAGEIIARLEGAGFEVVERRRERPPEELFRQLYAEPPIKPQSKLMTAYMMSGEVCFLRVRREDAIEQARLLEGPTDPEDAPAGTIRGDLGIDFRPNSVHASDSPDTARRELDLVFPQQ